MDLWISPKYLVVVGWQINHPFKWSFHALLHWGPSTPLILFLSSLCYWFLLLLYINIWPPLYKRLLFSTSKNEWPLKKSLPLSVPDEFIELFQSLWRFITKYFYTIKKIKVYLVDQTRHAYVHMCIRASLPLFDLLWITTEKTCIDRTI